jgi:hypothetical protein
MRSGPLELLPRAARLDRAGLAVFHCSSFEALHPETKHGENQYTGSRKVCDNQKADRFIADTAQKTARCLYCLSPLPNGAPVCSDECDEGWWEIVPTVTGELYFREQRHDRREQDQSQHDRQSEPALVKRLAWRQRRRQSPPA